MGRAGRLAICLLGLSAAASAAAWAQARGPAAAVAAGAAAGTGRACSDLAGAVERPAPARLVAIGDLHGDLAAARAALRLAGAIDARDHWIGGRLGVVQLGDILDRGDDDRRIIDLFERLEREAGAAGGSFTWLLGNHELMNSAGDFRYVTAGGFRAFAELDAAPRAVPAAAIVGAATGDVAPRARAEALRPGGLYARVLAGQQVAVRIGRTVLSHAGLTAPWARDLAGLSRSARCWLAGAGPAPAILSDTESPVWTRRWGGGTVDCVELDRVLAAAGADRMVVAHTVQPGGITSACAGRLWRIDTGMSARYGGPIQVLELTGRGPSVLRAR